MNDFDEYFARMQTTAERVIDQAHNRIKWAQRIAVVAIIAIVAVVAVVFLAGCKADSAAANKSAAKYMQNVPGATGYECVASDSDGDGYCSCTIFRGSADPLPVNCGCERMCVWNCAEGCKYTPFAGGKR